ncbi:HEAT repeat domain-containing protein [Frigoriglobus tundricola]|uniref:HEAT repeat domain-containing protein n=1 Tax=Frigoriglobus tundricola TaxID=2774151 RepID=A0A6M5YYG5_9BACT|nr:HEAT repeat domain-containing protein [Frigoriglobus tundricola]QJW98301.1 hypothetical protein FTUN_5889 [Frigoriglobus tundricola]
MRVSLLAAVLVVASAPALVADEPEAKYKGKPLDYWVEQLQKAPTDEQQKVAAAAVAAFGRQAQPAVPKLLAMLEDRSWEFRGLIAEILLEIGPHTEGIVPVLAQRLKENKVCDPDLVIDLLRELDPDRKETIPALIAALDHRETRFFAVRELCKGPAVVKDALPTLRRAALQIVLEEEKSPSKSVVKWQRYGKNNNHNMSDSLEDLHGLGEDAVPILLALLDAPGKLGKTAALKEFAKLGPVAVKSAPALKKQLKHDDPRVRYFACAALWAVAESPDVVPVLVQLMDAKAEPSVNWDMEAAKLLGDIGPKAKDALPPLKALAQKQWDPADYAVPSELFRPHSAQEAARWAIDRIEGKAKK